jgi:hypothetical protein
MRLLLLMLALIAASSGTHAQVMNESACRLQYLTGVQSTAAVLLIDQACNFLSTQSASMDLNRRDRLYNECLLRRLAGVQNDHAANLIAQACRDSTM